MPILNKHKGITMNWGDQNYCSLHSENGLIFLSNTKQNPSFCFQTLPHLHAALKKNYT